MTEQNQTKLGKTLWVIADQLRGASMSQSLASVSPWKISNSVSFTPCSSATHDELVGIEKAIAAAKEKHNGFLKELGLSPLP